MSAIFKEKINTILNSKPDLTGFTTPIFGELKRYVVANTHNKPDVSINKLTTQAEVLFLAHNNVNVGGWQDSKTGEIYLDISTSFDNLKDAINFAKETKQIAIWDNIEFKEIKIQY